ncbi:MAG: D-alanyl-D-alanine carboxypeptidase family protein, partial [Actinomycetota bacterium]
MAQRSPRNAIFPSDQLTQRSFRSVALLLAATALALPRVAAAQPAPRPPLVFAAQPAPSAPPPAPAGAPLVGPEVQAGSATLLDAVTGTVVWEKDAHTRRPNASTTKIMTATLILDSGRLDDLVTFSAKARATPYANLNAKPGEQFRVRDLLYAIMLRSSNDSCVAMAEHLCGEAWKFSHSMTQKARSLGALNTNFVSTNGLYDKNHYSTAYDLALMTRNAIRNPLFNEVVGTKSKTIDRSLNQKDRLIRNHNKFLKKYQGADGVKTGYVRQSGRCLVASATGLDSGQPWRLITVVLNSADTYGDSARMMDWGRQNFQPVFFARRGEQLASASVTHGTLPKVPLVASEDLMAIVRRTPGVNRTIREVRASGTLKAPVDQDQVAGKVVALVDGRQVAEIDLKAQQPVGQVWTASVAPFTGWSLLMVMVYLG